MVANKFWSSQAALLLFSFAPTPLPAQGAWSQTPTVGSPAMLVGHSAAYDMVRERMVLFGGADPTYTVQDTTWEFDGVTWAQTNPAQSPSARIGHAMAYDAGRARIVMFGGAWSILASTGMNDTWEFDGNGWTPRLAIPAPPARMDHAMAFDMTRGRCVLHGGRMSPQSPLADTWEWDGTSWVLRSTTGPSPRFHHALAYDLSHTRCVAFGGYDGITSFAETWEWDGIAWLQRTPSVSPPPRAGHGMAYDINRMVTVMHGGTSSGDETWEWDGINWSQHGSTTWPKANHVLVYDARLGRTTLFGGTIASSPPTFIAEVETYGHLVPGSFVPHGSSCAGSAATPILFAPPASPYSPLIGQTSTVQVTHTWFHTFFAFGWSDTVEGATSLPYDLTSYGMPGCSLQVSRDAITSAIPHNGVATLSIPIANDPFLVGIRFFLQGFSLDLAANAGGFTTTNRLEAIVGRT